MKKATIYFASVIIILFVINTSFAQNNGNRAVFDSAYSYFSLTNYQRALPLFLKFYESDTSNANAAYHVGVCYKHMPSAKYKSIPFLEKASLKVSQDYENSFKEKSAPIRTFFDLGNAYLLNYDLSKAILATKKYKSLLNQRDNPNDIKEADRQIEMCNTAKKLVERPVPILVENLGSHINTNFPEYAPVVNLACKSLFFTSRRNTNIGEMIEQNGYYFEDIYFSIQNKDNFWGEAVNMGTNINSKDHEASISSSHDNKQLFIYKDDGGDGNIYVSNYIDNSWTKPQKLPPPINSNSWETHASLSPDGNTLFYTSDRKGGFGGLDIYMSKKLPNGRWGEANNLGDTINSEFNEDGPFILSNNTLYFCSEGHNTMGGYDIFYSKQKTDGTWSQPVNMGYPINTTDNDMFYYPIDSATAYFASVREIDDFGIKGFGNLDIYRLTIHELKLRGLAIDKQTNKIIPGTKVILKNENMEDIAVTVTDDKGEYSFAVDHDKNYNLLGKKEEYTDGSNKASTYNIGDAKEIVVNLRLERMPSVSLKIIMTDAQTGQTLKDVSVIIKDIKSNGTDNYLTNEYGEAYKTLDDKKINDSLRYYFTFVKEGYLVKNRDFKYLITKPGEILVKEQLEKPQAIKIRGIAYDKNTNEIIPGTEVTLMNEKKEVIARAYADENGAYTFTAEYNRNYYLNGKKETYTEGNNVASTYNMGNAKEVVANLKLERTLSPSLKIEVTDAETGQPIKDVNIVLKDLKPNTYENFLTNETGEAFKTLGDKKINDSLKYYLTFTKEGYLPKNQNFTYQILTLGEILIKEQLEKIPAIKIRGIAYDKNTSEIIPGTEVSLMNENKEVIAKVYADEKGAYSFTAEYNKTYYLNGKKETYTDGNNVASTFNMGNAKEVVSNLQLEKIQPISLKLLVADAKTNEPLKSVCVLIKDLKTGKIINASTDEKGEIITTLKDKNIKDSLSYEIRLTKEEYITKTVNYRYLILKPGEILVKEIIGKIEVGADLGKIFTINPIYFDLDKYNIRPDAAVELNKIVKIMNEYPEMVIELGSHTDCRASYAYNMTLSDNRAKSSAAYIQQRITKPERIYGKGYGETRLVNNCECEGKKIVPCTEEQHQMNRRTEFIIISIGETKVVPEKTEIPGGLKIKGIVYDQNSNQIVPGAEVTLMTENMEVVAKTNADQNGSFSLGAEYNKNYKLVSNKESFTETIEIVSTYNICEAKEVTANIKLKRLPSIILKILVNDAKTNQPLQNVTVILKDCNSGATENLTTNDKGEIIKPLSDKNIKDSLCYNIDFSKETYISKNISFRYLISKTGEILVKEVIGKIEVGADLGKVFQINPIYFDLDKYNIRPDAARELDKIVKIMNEYPNMVIELGSHTDCRSSYAYNMTLSENRAKSSASYIQQRITNPERIYGKGYGETRLVNECACEGKNVVPCTEQQHQMNRRTEFIIIKY